MDAKEKENKSYTYLTILSSSSLVVLTRKTSRAQLSCDFVRVMGLVLRNHHCLSMFERKITSDKG